MRVSQFFLYECSRIRHRARNYYSSFCTHNLIIITGEQLTITIHSIICRLMITHRYLPAATEALIREILLLSLQRQSSRHEKRNTTLAHAHAVTQCSRIQYHYTGIIWALFLRQNYVFTVGHQFVPTLKEQ